MERRDGPRTPVMAVATEAVTMVDVCTMVAVVWCWLMVGWGEVVSRLEVGSS